MKNNIFRKNEWRYYCNKHLLFQPCYCWNNVLIAVISLAIAVIKPWKYPWKSTFPPKTHGVITVTSPSNNPFITGASASPWRGLLLGVAPWAQGSANEPIPPLGVLGWQLALEATIRYQAAHGPLNPFGSLPTMCACRPWKWGGCTCTLAHEHSQWHTHNNDNSLTLVIFWKQNALLYPVAVKKIILNSK